MSQHNQPLVEESLDDEDEEAVSATTCDQRSETVFGVPELTEQDKADARDATQTTVRGTRDNGKTEAVLSKWEKDVRADAALHGGVVPPKISHAGDEVTVRLNDAPKPVPPPLDTEAELNGLIAECRFLLHEVAFHSARLTYDPGDRIRFLSAAESLARTAATVGDTVSRLRNGGSEPALVHEHHQLVTVEHVQTTRRGEGDRGKSRKSSKQ